MSYHVLLVSAPFCIHGANLFHDQLLFFCLLLDPESSPPLSADLVGDMKLTSKQKLAVKLGRDVGTGENTFAGSNKATLRWPNAIIPYTIDCSLGVFLKFYLPFDPAFYSHLLLRKLFLKIKDDVFSARDEPLCFGVAKLFKHSATNRDGQTLQMRIIHLKPTANSSVPFSSTWHVDLVKSNHILLPDIKLCF